MPHKIQQRNLLKTCFSAIPLMSLTACSYDFEMFVSLVDGEVAFISADREITCVSSLQVTKAARLTHSAEGETDPTFWSIGGSYSNCAIPYPVVYGQRIESRSAVARPLEPGEKYIAQAESAGHYASVCFEILPSGAPNNLPMESCYPSPSQQ